MTRLEEIAERAGAAVREDARRLADRAPDLRKVAAGRTRHRAVVVSTVALMAVIGGLIVIGPGWWLDQGVLVIEDRLGDPPQPAPAEPDEPGRDERQENGGPDGSVTGPDQSAVTEGDPADWQLPGGWSVAALPVDTDGKPVTVATGATFPALVVGDDLLLPADAGGWQVHSGVVERRPDLLTTGGGDDRSWVLMISSHQASLIRDDGTPVPVDPLPLELQGSVLDAVWWDGGFVVVGPAAGPHAPTPAYLLEPSGGWQQLPGAPLAVNRAWNTSLAATDGAVWLLGAWLDSNNRAAHPTLAAARLDTDRRWTLIDGGVLSPQSADAVAADGRLLAVDYEGMAAWLTDDGWSEPEPTGMPASECGSALAVSGQQVLAAWCDAALLDLSTGRWTRIAAPARSLGQAMGTDDGFVIPLSQPTSFGARTLALLTVDPATTWPRTSGYDGVIATPPGWSIAPEPTTDDDAELVTASTAPMPHSSDPTCPGLPVAALDALGPGDALAIIRRGTSAPGEAPELGAITTTDLEPTRQHGRCLSEPERLMLYEVKVRYGPESLDILIAHHADAPPTRLEQATAVANTYSLR